MEKRKRPAPHGTAAYPRKRAVNACQTCRSRKTKCDNRRPSCSFCEGAGATCIYSASDFSTYDPASLAILDRLDQLEDNLKAHLALGSPTLLPSSNVSTSTTAFTSPFVETEHASQPKPVNYVDNDSDHDIQLLPNTVEYILAWPVFKGRFDGRTRLMQLLRISGPLEQSIGVNFDLDMVTCDHLLERCIEHILSKNPVVEEGSLRKTMKYVYLNGIGWNTDSCLVLLVCALGSIASLDAS